jgi:putative tricarboxylic transport membrane protein
VKLNDAIWGALFLVLGGAILIHVQAFPTIPGQKVGPALFPGLIAIGLAVCGLLLVLRGMRASRSGDARTPWIAVEPWIRSPRHALAFALFVGANVFYLVAVDRLGFLITATLYLVILLWALRAKLAYIVPIALGCTLCIHYAFYKLLKVPLPWGVLHGIAW